MTGVTEGPTPDGVELLKTLPDWGGATNVLLASFLIDFGASPCSSLRELAVQPPLAEWPAGTKLMVGSFPLCSAFKLGKLAGARRAVGTFPRL